MRQSALIWLIFAGCVLWTSSLWALEPVSQVRIYEPSMELLLELKHLEFDVIAVAPGKQADLLVTADELRELQGRGLKPEVIYVDYSAAMAERALREKGAGGGSMGGYHTFAEVVAELDAFRLRNPAIVSQKFSIGTSLLGNPIWAIKISDNVALDEDEPEVFYNALIHAREPEGMECLLYYIDYLLTNYGTASDITTLVNEREMYFVPVVNPDGYLYNQQTNPNGGGYWRKNRRGNMSSVWGVDLNRNFGYMWGYDNSGSSSSQSAEDYRGSAGFSEPETQVIRDFCISRDFQTALNYHTYSNLLIRPFGYDDVQLNPPSDLAIYDAWGAMMTAVNGYEYGDPVSTVGYRVNGGTDDWMYGERSEKPKIMSLTPEVGSYSDGFWPSPSRIIPLAQENLEMNLLIAQLAGVYVAVSDAQWDGTDENGNGYPDAGEIAYFSEAVTSIGRGTASNVTVEMTSNSTGIDIQNPLIDLGSIAFQQTVDFHATPFRIALDASLNHGQEVNLVITVKADGRISSSETLHLMVGAPTRLFHDSASAGTGQFITTGSWNVVTSDFHTSPASFTDSPGGSYLSNSDTTLTIRNPVSLAILNRPVIRFWTKWRIESEWDFATVEISTNNGSTWTALEGRHTSPGSGSGRQPAGVPGYDGTQSTWIEEEIDLSAYRSANDVRIRFRLASDSSQVFDGWYIDDVSIEGYTATGGVPSLGYFGLILLLGGLGFVLRKKSENGD